MGEAAAGGERAVDPRGEVLLRLARRSLEEALGCAPGGEGLELAGGEWLRRPGATFVTLVLGGELRGCVGSVTVNRSVAEDVWENARAAAFRDIRFPPLTAAELRQVGIEVSLLSALVPLEVAGETAARAALRPGVDGVLLAYGPHRGIFLPQVWEQLTTPAAFLEGLKRKAGLPPDLWAPEVELWRFTVTKWREAAARREAVTAPVVN